MNTWMTFWTILLAVSCGAFLLMLVVVAMGAVSELRETLDDLRKDTEESAAHPEVLNERF